MYFITEISFNPFSIYLVLLIWNPGRRKNWGVKMPHALKGAETCTSCDNFVREHLGRRGNPRSSGTSNKKYQNSKRLSNQKERVANCTFLHVIVIIGSTCDEYAASYFQLVRAMDIRWNAKIALSRDDIPILCRGSWNPIAEPRKGISVVDISSGRRRKMRDGK